MNRYGNELNCPQEVLEWIPWYAEDALAETQRGVVEAHAAQCEDCRVELAMLSGGPAPSATAPDPDRVFARVLARIEAEGVETRPVRVGAHMVPATTRRAPLLQRSDRSGRPSLLQVAASAALMLGMVAAGWFLNAALVPHADAVYRAASDAGSTPRTGASGVQLDVVFLSNAGIEQINTDLRALGAVVVSGPSQAGRYRVTLPEGADASAAVAMLRAEGSAVASFAEPLRP